jgi:acyl dehydratase
MNASRPDIYFDDVIIGARFDSGRLTLTEQCIAQFCDLTHDHHPLHTDAAYARSRGFSGVIAHGLYGLALMEGLKTELRLYENSSIASLGWSDVRFVRPAVAGDTVHVTFEFVEKRPTSKPGRGIVVEALQLINQNGDVVIDARHTALLACRQNDGGTS